MQTLQINLIRSGDLSNLSLWNLKDVDKVVFPIHFPGHWAVVLGCLKERRLSFLDSSMGISSRRWKHGILKKIKHFLDTKVCLPLLEDGLHKKFVTEIITRGVSQQEDGKACGFFCLGWAELFAQGVEGVHSVMNQERSDMQRKQVEQYLKHSRFKCEGYRAIWRPHLVDAVAVKGSENPKTKEDRDPDYDSGPGSGPDWAVEENIPPNPTQEKRKHSSDVTQERTQREERRARKRKGKRTNRRKFKKARTQSNSKKGEGKVEEVTENDCATGTTAKRTIIKPVGGSISLVSSGEQRNETPTEVKVAFWNVTSLSHRVSEVNSAGGIDMERSQQVVRILYLMQKMIDEDIYLMCLQETRLQDKVYRYKSGFVLVNHNTERTGHRGVGILLSPNAYKAWNKAKRRRMVDGDGRSIFIELATQTSGVHWVVGSQYSPRSKHPEQVNRFYTKLTEMLGKVHAKDHLTFGGDFNGAVSRSGPEDSLERRQIVGPINPELQTKNGDELVKLCAKHNLSLPQTYVQTGEDEGVTWVGNKMMTCKPRVYDYVVCRRRQIRCYHKIDVRTDWLGINTPHYPIVASIQSKFNRKRKSDEVDSQRDTPLEDRSQKLALESLKTAVKESCAPPKKPRAGESKRPSRKEPEEGTAEKFWGYIMENTKEEVSMQHWDSVVREAGVLCKDPTVEKVSWDSKHRQELAELAQRRGETLRVWKKDVGNESKKKMYKRARNILRNRMRHLLNKDLQALSKELEDRSRGVDKEFYKLADRLSIHHGTGGWATKAGHVKDVETHMRKSRKHFAKISNVIRSVNMEVLKGSPEFTRARNLVDWSAPDKDEVMAAVKGLKQNKSQDMIGVQPELLKAACEDPLISDKFYNMVRNMWNGKEDPPSYWNQSVLIPLYKGKGKFDKLDNWRGISIQAWSRKVFMRCMLNRLNQLVAICVHGSQAGFRTSRSCADVTFTLRRIMEDFRALQKRTADTGGDLEEDLHMLFVDFSKAFDSVPREALWYLLQHKYHVPEHVVKVLRKLYAHTMATISYKGQLDSETFKINVGVLQGDVASPVFWILYLNSLLATWRSKVGKGAGVKLRYQLDGSIRPLARSAGMAGGVVANLTDVEFADDCVLLMQGWSAFARSVKLFAPVVEAYGLRMNLKPGKTTALRLRRLEKTKHSKAYKSALVRKGKTPEVIRDNLLRVRQGGKMHEIHWATEVWHLGSTIGTDETLGVLTDIRKRFWKAVSSMTRSKAVWWSKIVTRSTKGTLLRSWILPMFLYACESWGMTPTVKNAVRKKWNILLRMAIGKRSRRSHQKAGITLVALRKMLQCHPILFYINKRATAFAFHIARRSDVIPPWWTMFGGVLPTRSLKNETTRGQRSLLRWYITLLDRRDVPGYDYRIWSRIAQDRQTANDSMMNAIAYSEYKTNQTRMQCGKVDEFESKLTPPTRERSREEGAEKQKLHCPCACNFEATLPQDITRHITTEHPLITCEWKCSCGYVPVTMRDVNRHSSECASLGKMHMRRQVRRTWRRTPYGRMQETKAPAIWLLAEGDPEVWRVEYERRLDIQAVKKQRRLIEGDRRDALLLDSVDADHAGELENENCTPLPQTGEIQRVWTDGACERNGKPDALAGWGVFFGDADHRNLHSELEGPTQTNQRAELSAAIYVLYYFASLNPPKLACYRTLATDSTYVINGIEKVSRWAALGWRKDDGSEVANMDLWTAALRYHILTQGMVKYEHVYGHSGNRGNDGADRLAVRGALGVDLGEDTNGNDSTEFEKVKRRAHRRELERRRRRDELALTERIGQRNKERHLVQQKQSAVEHSRKLVVRKVLEGVAALDDYVRARDEARRRNTPTPAYPEVHRCKKCGWPGHARPHKGVCPLHPKYDGILPRCHFRREEAKHWISSRQRARLEGQQTIEVLKPHVCEICYRRFRTRGQMTTCAKRCGGARDRGLVCDTRGCEYRATSRKELRLHKRVCTFNRCCPFCGKLFQNATRDRDGTYVATKKGRRMKHITFRSHLLWTRENGYRTPCIHPGCTVIMHAPACVHPNYREGNRHVRDLRVHQGQRGTHCRRHRTRLERSVPLTGVEMDSLIADEESHATEAQDRKDQAEWEEYVRAWESSCDPREEREEAQFMKRMRRTMLAERDDLQTSRHASDPVVTSFDLENQIAEASIVENYARKMKEKEAEEEKAEVLGCNLEDYREWEDLEEARGVHAILQEGGSDSPE